MRPQVTDWFHGGTDAHNGPSTLISPVC